MKFIGDKMVEKELSSVEKVICWYTNLEGIEKRKIHASMSDLFSKMPAYQEYIQKTYSEDESEVDTLGPAMLTAAFGNLRKQSVIEFEGDVESGKYLAKERDDLNPKYVWLLIESDDWNGLMDNGLDYIIKSGGYYSDIDTKEMSNMAKLLKKVKEASRSNQEFLIMDEINYKMPKGYSLSDAYRVTFEPFVFVKETRDYNQIYRCLEESVEAILLSSMKELESFPGLKIEAKVIEKKKE